MNKKTIDQLSWFSEDVSLTDVVEIQRPGTIETKKITLSDLFTPETDARIQMDDNIKTGAGLNADGSFSSVSGSSFLKAADFAAASLVPNLRNATRLLDGAIGDMATLIQSNVLRATFVIEGERIRSLNTLPESMMYVPPFGFILIPIACIAEFHPHGQPASANPMIGVYNGTSALSSANPLFKDGTLLEESQYAVRSLAVNEITVGGHGDANRGISIWCPEGNPDVGDDARLAVHVYFVRVQKVL